MSFLFFFLFKTSIQSDHPFKYHTYGDINEQLLFEIPQLGACGTGQLKYEVFDGLEKWRDVISKGIKVIKVVQGYPCQVKKFIGSRALTICVVDSFDKGIFNEISIMFLSPIQAYSNVYSIRRRIYHVTESCVNF